MKCEFTYKHYREILELAKKEGYTFQPFADYYQLTGRHIILRHDIDFSLPAALRLAKIEADLGVRATYFPMLRATSYNLLSPEHKGVMQKILSLGHDLGLHFDEKTYHNATVDSTDESIAWEAAILSCEFDSVVAVSFHQPSAKAFNFDSQYLKNAYAYNDLGFNYTSDSCSRWRQGCLCEMLKEGKHGRIQALVHGEWWTEAPETIDERWDNVYYDNLNLMERHFLGRASAYTKERNFHVTARD